MIGRTILVVGLLALLSAAGDLAACPVCFGEAEDSTLDAARWSVIFLGALLYGVIAGGGLMFLLLRRRARRLAGSPETA